MKRVTIADVAKLSGVSISTVSYALSNKRPISEETRLRIREAIQELDYRPNPSAKRLASGEKSRNIGFVLPLKGTGISGLEMKFISGAARAINEAGYTFVLLAHTDRNPENMLRFAQNGVVDGFILMEVLLQDDRVELLKRKVSHLSWSEELKTRLASIILTWISSRPLKYAARLFLKEGIVRSLTFIWMMISLVWLCVRFRNITRLVTDTN